jgi:enoyl-CoA hydratase/carnithine racemase
VDGTVDDAGRLVLADLDDDGVLTLTWNRPERRNGWSPELENAYFARLDEAATDQGVRVVVLTGAGPTFCPGLDMARLSGLAEAPRGLDLTDRRFHYAPREFPKPLIAAINGACAGIGLVQALMCDVRFAADTARFSTAFARRGLAAEYGLSWVLPRYVGPENALDLLLSARTFDAAEARRLGLVSRVAPAGEVLAAAHAYAGDIARNASPTAMAVIKSQVLADLDRGFEDALRRSYAAMHEQALSPDLGEGVRAFTERRAPRFAPLPADFDVRHPLRPR